MLVVLAKLGDVLEAADIAVCFEQVLVAHVESAGSMLRELIEFGVFHLTPNQVALFYS